MEETSYQAMKKLMELTDPPTAVFTANNYGDAWLFKIYERE